MSTDPTGSSQPAPDIFGLTGMPSRTSSNTPPATLRPSHEIPSVAFESPTVGPHEGTTLRLTSSEGNLLDQDRLSALPPAATLPRTRGSTHSTPQRTNSHPPLDDESGRRSTESEPTPGRPLRNSESPRGMRGVLQEALGRPFRTDTHRGSPPSRTSPRIWPLPFLPLTQTRSRPEPFEPRDPYRSDFRNLAKRRFRFRHWFRYLVRQFIRHALLRLPSVYFTRVRRVFESAELSKHEIARMIEARTDGTLPRTWTRETASPSALLFQEAWQEFIESVMKEWKAMNIVSALLITGILTLFQIEDASNSPTTRTTALISLICSLMSLLYGGTYILRFGTMRGMDKAVRWAEEMEQTTGSSLWNVWVLISCPVVWLVWSIAFFLVAILSFVWTTGTTIKPAPLTPKQAIAPRLVVTLVFALGLVVFLAVLRSFRSWSTAGQMKKRKALKDLHASPEPVKIRELKGEKANGDIPPLEV